MHVSLRFVTTILLVLLSSTTLSCGKKTPASNSNVLRYALIEEPASLDPPSMTSLDTGELLGNIFEGLVNYDTHMKIVPWLADSWEISPDKLTYTFHLNPKAKFHAPISRQVTATDVKWSMERVLKPAMKAPLLTALFVELEGAQDVIDGKSQECSGIHVIDTTTISFKTKKPSSFMLQEFAGVNVFCRESIEKGGGHITAQNCIGTGPYMLSEYASGKAVTLVANPDYYRGRPKLDKIVRPIVLSRETSHLQYEAGETDICHTSFADYKSDHVNPKLKDQSLLMPYFGCSYIVMQPDVLPAFKDIRVRRAFAEAIDTDTIIRVVYDGAVLKAGGLLPPGVLGHDDKIRPIHFDPEHARKLLADAGFADGKGFPSLALQFATDPQASAITQIVRENLKTNLGIEVQIKEREAGTFYGEVGRNKVAFYTIGWNAPDPHDFLTVQLHTGGKYNTFGFKNPKFDVVSDAADAEFDPVKREMLYRQADQIAIDEVAAIPLIYNRTPFLINPKVHDLEYNLGGLLPHYRTYIGK